MHHVVSTNIINNQVNNSIGNKIKSYSNYITDNDNIKYPQPLVVFDIKNWIRIL